MQVLSGQYPVFGKGVPEKVSRGLLNVSAAIVVCDTSGKRYAADGLVGVCIGTRKKIICDVMPFVIF